MCALGGVTACTSRQRRHVVGFLGSFCRKSPHLAMFFLLGRGTVAG